MSELLYLATLSDIKSDISEIERFYFKQMVKKIVQNKITNIVIVSSNIRLKNILKRKFKNKNYNVSIYSSYKTAFEKIINRENFVILFDINFLNEMTEDLVINLKNALKICITDLNNNTPEINEKVSSYCDYIFKSEYIQYDIVDINSI